MDGLQVDESAREKTFVPPEQEKIPAPEKPLPVVYSDESSDTQRPQPSSSRLPWGLSVLAYTFFVAGLTFLICGAGFGGALGGVVARHKQSDSGAYTVVQTATVTATVTNTVSTASASPSGLISNYSPLLPEQVNTTVLDCTDKATVTSQSGDQYQLNCNINYPDNDLLNFVAYSVDTCIGACSNFNKAAGKPQCHGVLFNANMQQMSEDGGGNCWLKSVMTNPTVDGLPPSVGAVLLS